MSAAYVVIETWPSEGGDGEGVDIVDTFGPFDSREANQLAVHASKGNGPSYFTVMRLKGWPAGRRP